MRPCLRETSSPHRHPRSHPRRRTRNNAPPGPFSSSSSFFPKSPPVLGLPLCFQERLRPQRKGPLLRPPLPERRFPQAQGAPVLRQTVGYSPQPGALLSSFSTSLVLEK